MQLLRATADQADLIAPLFDQYRQFYRYPSDLAGARRFLRERLEKNESVIFLALEEREAVGFTQLYPMFSSTKMRPMWILNDLFVLRDRRKAGIAAALLEKARQFGIERGAVELMLETAVDNLAAQRLYEKLGWKRDIEFYTYHLYL
jgi:GNAT superfamily N-acetyltransferase